MMPGIPGGTQLAMGVSCGGWARKSFRKASYLGVRANCCGGPKSPAPRAAAPVGRPKVISQTPFMSGSCAMEAQVPPGSLPVSAAGHGLTSAIKSSIARRKKARRMCCRFLKHLLYNTVLVARMACLATLKGVKIMVEIRVDRFLRNGPARDARSQCYARCELLVRQQALRFWFGSPLGARSSDLGGVGDFRHPVHLSARKSGGHQHDAHAGRPGADFHQQVCLPVPFRQHRTGRHGGLLVSRGPDEIVYQARDRYAG